MNAVVARDLTRRFGSFTAVDHVCFSIPQGAVYGFLGPNGSGKTTTIRMLTGILEPTEGSAVILGLDIAGDRDAVKSRLGYMSQRFSLYDDLTVSENLEFYAGMFSLPRSVARGRIEEVVGMAGLSGRTGDLAGSLSGGIRQRLALGCAILHRPELLFLDEPTSGVDPVSRRKFWDIIYELAAGGTTIMVTTHFMDEAEHCDAIGFMFDGRLIASGTPRELKQLLPGSSWELLSDHPMDLLEKLERRPGIVDASVHGRALHLQVERGWEDEVASMGANRIVPSLEDVFVHLVRKHGKERNS